MLATHGSSTVEPLRETYAAGLNWSNDTVCFFFTNKLEQLSQSVCIFVDTQMNVAVMFIYMPLNVFVYLFVRNECDDIIKSGKTLVCFLVN